MKKILSVLLLLNLVSMQTFAVTQTATITNDAFAPQWSDVCSYSAYHSISTTKKYYKVDKQYWQQRRIQFEKELQQAQTYKNPEPYYQKIIALEADRTAKWEATYMDERKARLAKGGIAAGLLAVLGAFTCLAKWW